MLHTLIMAGGGGTRFWPRSRQQKPKQFLKLVGDSTLLQQALERIEVMVTPAHTWVITGSSYCAETGRQLPTLPTERIIGEPCGRDTAACIGLGAALIARDDPEAVMLVMPADHVIEPAQEFRRAVHVAAQMVLEHPDALVTFGIPPTFAATGYGYIKRDAELPSRQGIRIFRVHSFEEKPHLERAEEFVAAGTHYWNGGIFVWRAATILKELREKKPSLAAAVERIADAWDTPQREEILAREYPVIEKISIDFAVMAKAKTILVLEAPFAWDDVGSWLALERRFPQDAQRNTVLARHAGIDTHNCIIVGDDEKLVATVGVSDLIIIQDGDAILVAQRHDESGIKKLVELLKERGLEKHL